MSIQPRQYWVDLQTGRKELHPLAGLLTLPLQGLLVVGLLVLKDDLGKKCGSPAVSQFPELIPR